MNPDLSIPKSRDFSFVSGSPFRKPVRTNSFDNAFTFAPRKPAASRLYPNLKQPGTSQTASQSRVQFNDEPSYYSAPSRPSTTITGSSLFDTPERHKGLDDISGLRNGGLDTSNGLQGFDSGEDKSYTGKAGRTGAFMSMAEKARSERTGKKSYGNLNTANLTDMSNIFGSVESRGIRKPRGLDDPGSNRARRSTSFGLRGSRYPKDEQKRFETFLNSTNLFDQDSNNGNDPFVSSRNPGLYSKRSNSLLDSPRKSIFESRFKNNDGYPNLRIPTSLRFIDTVPAAIVELSQASPQVKALLSSLESVSNKFERQEKELSEMQGATHQLRMDTETLSSRLKEFGSTIERQRRTLEKLKNKYR